MKKFFLAVAIALPFVMTSCTEDEPQEPITLSSTAIELNIGEFSELTASEKGTWTSSNEFVATVDKNGKVEAAHVGEAEITVTKDGESATCKVVVKPVNTDYTFPNMIWGADVKTVKESMKDYTLYDESVEDGGTILSYLTGEDLPGYIYIINDAEGLTASSIVLDIEETDNFDAFLYQYYADYDEDEEFFYLLDAYTFEKASVAVQYGLNDETSIIATFVPTTIMRSGDIKSMFESLNFNRSVFKNIK